jgi:hypothetical protein
MDETGGKFNPMRRLTHLFVLGAFIFSCGGQWYVLQCVAWVNMIHDYSQVVPVTEAVKMTFSGKYPCPICKAIAERKQSENTKVAAISKYEKKFFPPSVSLAPRATPPSPETFAPWELFFQTWSETPPTPPPRFA